MEEPHRRPRLGTAVRYVGPASRRDRPGREELAAAVELAELAERGGVGAFFVGRSAHLGAYALLGAVAASTERLVLGRLGAPAGERPPALHAKLAASLDVLARGRALLGLAPPVDLERAVVDQGLEGSGAGPAEATAPGSEPDPLALLQDTVEVCRAMVRVAAPSYAGVTARLEAAWNEPRIEEPAPLPLGLLVPYGHERTLDLLALGARFVELCAIEVGEDDPSAALPDALAAACLAAGRLSGDVELVAVCDAPPVGGGRGVAVSPLLRRAAAWLAAGFDGIVVDVDLGAAPPHGAEPGTLEVSTRFGELVEGLAAVRV